MAGPIRSKLAFQIASACAPDPLRVAPMLCSGTVARLSTAETKQTVASGKDSNSYSSTLFLPKTTFPIRANAKEREPELQAICSDALYKWQFAAAQSGSGQEERKNFVLHDGPPYANGSLHMGHFLNKVLKDIVNRYKVCLQMDGFRVWGLRMVEYLIDVYSLQLMRGYRIDFVPGWDCHGLPIELKVHTYALHRVCQPDEALLECRRWD